METHPIRAASTARPTSPAHTDSDKKSPCFMDYGSLGTSTQRDNLLIRRSMHCGPQHCHMKKIPLLSTSKPACDLSRAIAQYLEKLARIACDLSRAIAQYLEKLARIACDLSRAKPANIWRSRPISGETGSHSLRGLEAGIGRLETS
ncbi:uncharacterized protein MYCFIDRAFT_172785 [Pseudocercospora fijiensis CIRAD86]|uniref:Uncharacterized protein n=1 Tax=Pseudocercospora fijiensis (strain CIRAD86) TaxID=383855 RepID=M3BCX3_PSEFD|nr:uncharacterized protein MYCFIDRAFT_172785 [Pseudocercospora fijiensis CIRAD86]EME87122.1 hypothetical protein MYCFIDRAFT_172785 [Pseudocercospora fijiensis CIRAD86]